MNEKRMGFRVILGVDQILNNIVVRETEEEEEEKTEMPGSQKSREGKDLEEGMVECSKCGRN